MLKTVSVMIAPASRPDRSSPKTVTSGVRLERSPCLLQGRDRLRQRGSRLIKRLVEFRSIDLRQRLAALHAVSDVDEPPLEITVHPGVNRRLLHRLNAARQEKIRRGGRANGKTDRDQRDGRFDLIDGGAKLALPP